MELRQLRSFCVVAREMHVTKAAAQLRVAQPALTRQIRALERDLGCPLMQKTGRGIALTQAGYFLYTESETILKTIEAMELRVKIIASGGAGHLTIGISEAAAFEPRLARVFDTYRRRWPEVLLTFSQREATDLGAAISQGEVDIAFTCPISAGPGMRFQTLVRHEMVLAVPVGHPLAKQEKVALVDLKEEALVIVSHGQALHTFKERLLKASWKLGFTPRFVQAVPELILALNLVAAGVGAAFVPDYMSSIRNDAIVYLRVASPTPLQMKLAVLTHTNGPISPLLKNLERTAREAFDPGARGRSARDPGV